MTRVTPLAFNTAMKRLSENHAFERDEAELAALAQTGSTLNDAGLQSARVLEALARELAGQPDATTEDLLGAWLNAAIGYAMFGDLASAQTVISDVPLEALALAPTYAMVACLCSPAHAQAILAANPHLAEFGRAWAVATSNVDLEQREKALAAAIDLMARAGLHGSLLERSLVLGARTGAWQVYRLTHALSGS